MRRLGMKHIAGLEAAYPYQILQLWAVFDNVRSFLA
jgi:hypothetical protein